MLFRVVYPSGKIIKKVRKYFYKSQDSDYLWRKERSLGLRGG